MSYRGVSDQEILRAIIAAGGRTKIPTSTAAEQLIALSQPKVSNYMKDVPLGTSSGVGYRAHTPNYKIDPRGNVVGDAMIDAASLYGDASGTFNDALSRPVRQARAGVGRVVGRGGRKMAGKAGSVLGALPGMGKLGAAARVLGPGLGAAGGVLGVGELVLGEESAPNKGMDAAAMTIGGLLGSAGGPLGVAAGAGLGKMSSDALQYLFGDKLTPEQRKMREALMMLQGGRY